MGTYDTIEEYRAAGCPAIVTVIVGNDPTVIGEAATHDELLKWAENVCTEIESRFGVRTMLVRGSSYGSADCSDPEIREWLKGISQSDEWMAYL